MDKENMSSVILEDGATLDPKLPAKPDDPRIKGEGAVEKALKKKGKGMNTESFDPASTYDRPSMRVLIGSNKVEEYPGRIKHDDVVMVPNFFCEDNDWELYYKLVEEMREAQDKGEKQSEWISWHEGAHLISKNPKGSPAYLEIQNRIAKYFGIEQKSVGTRFNWYRDSSDWKPFHHDSAAFNPQRAKNQNITVGVSFGATRELAFLHAQSREKVYFPQTNGSLISFGRDVNINWKHGINALKPEEQDGKGRISIILWGNCTKAIEEDHSPPMLTDNTRGKGHSMHGGRRAGPGGGGKHNNNNRSGGGGRDNRGRDRDHDRDRGGHGGRDRDRDFRRDRPRDNHFRDDRPRDYDRDREYRRDGDRDRNGGGDRSGDRDRRRDRSRSRDRG